METIFVLIVILLTPTGHMSFEKEFETMNDCFENRELIVEKIGRPIINYQAVCVQKTVASF